MLLRKRAMQA